MESTEKTFPELNTYQRRGLIVGLAGFVLLVIGGVIGGMDMMFQSYHLGFILVLNIALGSLGALALHHTTGGAWGYMIQRILEASTRTIPLVGIFFLIILFAGMESLFSAWLHPESDIVANKTPYLNTQSFVIRAVIIFALWLGLMYLFNKWSRDLDENGDPLIIVRFRRFGPPAIILFFLSVTVASIDWGMSLEPEWFSTIYGPLYVVSFGLTTLAFSIIALSYLDGRKPLSEVTNVEYYHHLGNLTLAFVVLWSYMSFAQYLITWSGNLPEEIVYYLPRKGGVMSGVALVLIVGHFAIPFFFLLFRRTKRTIGWLRNVCIFILLMRLVDIAWIVSPAFHANHLFDPNAIFIDALTDIAAIVGLGGLWFAFFCFQLKRRPLLAVNDPRMDDAFGRVEMLEHA